jgi:hypothetical protein
MNGVTKESNPGKTCSGILRSQIVSAGQTPLAKIKYSTSMTWMNFPLNTMLKKGTFR